MSFELDEVVPVSRLPMEARKAAACDESNVAPAHRACNQRKGNRMPGDPGPRGLAIRRSRDWRA